MTDQHDAEEERKLEVGDRVGLYHSDHEDYIFDNPTGVITDIKRNKDPDEPDWLTVQVEAQIGADRVFLIERDKTKEAV